MTYRNIVAPQHMDIEERYLYFLKYNYTSPPLKGDKAFILMTEDINVLRAYERLITTRNLDKIKY